MIFLFISILTVLSVLFILSRKNFQDFIEPINEKEYPFKMFMPISLYLLKLFNYKYCSKYDRMLGAKIAEIYGVKYLQYFLRIHWANKISLALLSLLFTVFIAVCTGADWSVAVFGFIVLCVAFFVPDKELDNKVKARRSTIQLDFPDFINKLILLVNAGMTVSKAWEKIVVDNKKDRPLYSELELTVSDIRAGKPEIKAYEDFAKRCRIPHVTKFVSVIIQNLKKGNSELVPILRLQATDCWELRKNTAKRLGEEASTKMLFPMMIMFIAILIIVSIPAVLAMSGI